MSDGAVGKRGQGERGVRSMQLLVAFMEAVVAAAAAAAARAVPSCGKAATRKANVRFERALTTHSVAPNARSATTTTFVPAWLLSFPLSLPTSSSHSHLGD